MRALLRLLPAEQPAAQLLRSQRAERRLAQHRREAAAQRCERGAPAAEQQLLDGLGGEARLV